MNIGAPWPSLVEAELRVLVMQTKLHQWATADPDRRFDDLANLVYDPAFLVVAWNRVRGNTGARTAGIDGIAPRSVVFGAAGLLERLRDDLKAGRFTPQRVREKTIPKTGGNVRALGIPTTADRVVQAALKLVLEPIFEVDFKPCSYGFRPKRRAQDAIAEIHLASEWDASLETADKLWWDLYRLFNNDFEAITIDNVTMAGAADPNFQQAKLVSLEKLGANRRWQTVSRRTPVRLVAGSEVFFRGVLRSVRTTRLTRVQLSFVVPRKVGGTGSLRVSAGAGFFDEPAGVASFDELVSSIDKAPTGDTLRAELKVTRKTPSGRQRVTREARATAPTAIFGDLFFEAKIVSAVG